MIKSISLELTNGEKYTYSTSEGWKINHTNFGFNLIKFIGVYSFCEMEINFEKESLWSYSIEDGDYEEEFFGHLRTFYLEVV